MLTQTRGGEWPFPDIKNIKTDLRQTLLFPKEASDNKFEKWILKET